MTTPLQQAADLRRSADQRIRQLDANRDLTPQAPAPLIKAAFRELAKLTHPDTQGGDAEEMKRLNNAFDVLKGRLAA